jgi:hypothetical protein
MTVDLADLIDKLRLDKKVLAKVLFPEFKRRDLALSRYLNNRTRLNDEQLYRLSTFTGLPIDSLYKSSVHWKSVTQGSKTRFTWGEYTALYDQETGIVKVLHLSKQIALHVIAPKVITLTEFLQSINSIIVKQQIKTT